MNKKLNVVATNEKGMKLSLELELNDEGLLVNYSVVDSNGTSMSHMESEDDPFCVFKFLNDLTEGVCNKAQTLSEESIRGIH